MLEMAPVVIHLRKTKQIMKLMYMYKPNISQTPPKAIRKLIWKISCFHNPRLKSLNEYSKVKNRGIFNSIWFTKRARSI